MARMHIYQSSIGDYESFAKDIAYVINANGPRIDALVAATETTISASKADGASTGGTNLSSATSTFVTATVKVGDYVNISKSANPENVGNWRVSAITSETVLVLDANLTADTSMTIEVNRGKMANIRHGSNTYNIDFL